MEQFASQRMEEYIVQRTILGRDAGGNKRFGAISKFALAVLTMPLSNATVERAFSIYSIIKSKLRNRLSFEMLQHLML
ncbi:Uncharacterized protein OBRU01_27377, partial [Operophtera brumata]